MHTKNQVLSKLNEFLSYSVTQEPDFESEFTGLMQPVITAVNGYFNTDRSAFKKPLDDLGLFLHNELWQRGAKWEGNFDMGLGTNPPESYNDLRKLFYQFPLMRVAPETFYSVWVWGVPEGSGEEGGATLDPIPLSNPLITSWVTEITSYPQTELKNIDSLATWLETSMSQSGNVMLWEEAGALIEAPETKDIAKTVFIDRGLLEAVNILSLPVYIPTHLRG